MRSANTSRADSTRPAARARVTSWMAEMLSPPSRNTSSSTPTAGSPSTSASSPASVASRAVRGATPVDSAPQVGRGQGPPVELAAGRAGQVVERHEGGGDHVLGQHQLGVGAHVVEVERPAPARATT